jgi:hypothetical protein
MMRGSFCPGHNQNGSNFGGGSNRCLGGGSFSYQQQGGGYIRPQQNAPRPNTEGFTPTFFACGKPGHKSYDYPNKKNPATPAKAPTPGGRPPPSASQQSWGTFNFFSEYLCKSVDFKIIK